MKSTRFNPPLDWNPTIMGNNKTRSNRYFFGLNNLILQISERFSFPYRENTKMIEIGCYSGESTLLFASSMAFDHIYCIDPFDGFEMMNDISGKDWSEIKEEFDFNTKYFDGDGSQLGETKVELIQDYSYNVVDKFEDNSIDFVYIDASHKLEDITRDINLYIPKLNEGGIIAGHDYNWPGVREYIDSLAGKNLVKFADESWAIVKEDINGEI
jgi:hypothetical protein